MNDDNDDGNVDDDDDGDDDDYGDDDDDVMMMMIIMRPCHGGPMPPVWILKHLVSVFINACRLLSALPSLLQFGRGRLSLVAIPFYRLSLLFGPCRLSEFTLAGPRWWWWWWSTSFHGLGWMMMMMIKSARAQSQLMEGGCSQHLTRV